LFASLAFRGTHAAWPVYIQCDNFVSSSRNSPDAKALLTFIEVPDQIPDESDVDYRYFKGMVVLRILKVLFDQLNAWSGCGVRVQLASDKPSEPSLLFPRFCKFDADTMEQRSLYGTFGSFAVRCFARVTSRADRATPKSQNEETLEERLTANEDIVLDMNTILEGSLAPDEVLCLSVIACPCAWLGAWTVAPALKCYCERLSLCAVCMERQSLSCDNSG
jgi:hypothetical protein